MSGFYLLLLALAGCAPLATPQSPEDARVHARFQADRERCRQVGERTFADVDPRGWNDPRFDGWRQGKS